jgi:sporulation protein YlmC with PRC-barrel domain
MKNCTNIARPVALAIAIAFAASSAAFAQAPDTTPRDPVPARTVSGVSKGDAYRANQAWERRHRASRIIGTDVNNRQGEKIGDIEDVVLDRNGSVAYAVVSTGGFLGIGDRLHAVPWKALTLHANEDHYILDVDRKRLLAAPGFPSASWPNFSDAGWIKENRRAYPEQGGR